MRAWGRDWPDSIPVDGAGGSLRSPRGTGWRYRTQPGDTRGLGWREFAGTLGWPAGSVPEGCRQTGCGIACSRARAQLNFSAQGQRSGRCRVRRRADRVRRPAREKTRRRRVKEGGRTGRTHCHDGRSGHERWRRTGGKSRGDCGGNRTTTRMLPSLAAVFRKETRVRKEFRVRWAASYNYVFAEPGLCTFGWCGRGCR